DGIPVSGLKCNAFAYRVFVRPIFARHRFVNDRDGLRFHRVAVVEETPADDRDLHGRKIVGGRGPPVTVRRRLSLRHNAPFHLETAPLILPPRWTSWGPPPPIGLRAARESLATALCKNWPAAQALYIWSWASPATTPERFAARTPD